LWDLIPCCCLHLQASYSESGGSGFYENVSDYLPNHTILHPRKAVIMILSAMRNSHIFNLLVVACLIESYVRKINVQVSGFLRLVHVHFRPVKESDSALKGYSGIVMMFSVPIQLSNDHKVAIVLEI